MPASLFELEAGRSRILREFGSPGDLRVGSICAVVRRCGKPGCHCSKPDDVGHDPQVRLTRRVNGKTVAESFPTPAAWRKAQAEIGEYHRFPPGAPARPRRNRKAGGRFALHPFHQSRTA